MKRPTDCLAPALIALACLTSGVLYANLAAPIIGPWPSALGKPVIAFGLPIAAIATYLILRSFLATRRRQAPAISKAKPRSAPSRQEW